MQDNDLNIEDFKEIFIKSLFRKTVSTQEISNYFEVESRKFIKWLSNELSNENDTQRFKDILLEKFIIGIEEAYTNLSNTFIEQAQNRLWDTWEWQGKGIDISEMDNLPKMIPLRYLCKKFEYDVHIELQQIEFIYEGFKLFKQQHEENSNMPNLPTPDQVEDSKTVDKKIKEDDISWNTKALFMFYRKKVDKNFSYQNTLSYFKCTDTKKYKPNYKQLQNAFTNMGRTKDRCLPTTRKDILRTIQELEKLESCKKSLEFARAECNDFNVSYPIQ